MSDANEVAEDYRLALEDLSTNMRFEISNLTVIARENTEHALTIADVLQTHILKVRLDNNLHINQIQLQASVLWRNLESKLIYSLGCSIKEASRTLCPRLDCQKRWHTVYSLFRPKPI